MALPSALHLALDLARSPILAGVMRRQPLPADVLTLIRLAARDDETTQAVSECTGRSPATLRTAAVLYIQQVLWTPDGDHYRALGLARGAPQEKLAEHLRWLMKWLHPDRQHLVQESAFSHRVLGAWNALKTQERRQQYDQSLRGQPIAKANRVRRLSARRVPWIQNQGQQTGDERRSVWWRVAGAAVIAAVLLVGILTIDWWIPGSGAAVGQSQASRSGASTMISDQADAGSN